MIYIESFYALLSTISLSTINPQITSSISMAIYSPPSSGNHRSLFVKLAKRGKQRAGIEAERCWCLGFVCLTLFYALLSTISPSTINPQITSFISMANYSPLSSERGWGRGFISPIPSPQQKGKVGHENARPFVISMKEWFILVATSQR